VSDEAKVIRMIPDDEGVMHMLPENEVLMDDEALEVLSMCHALYRFIAEHGASFGMFFDPETKDDHSWSVMLNFGREAPGSPMAAGSALGSGASAREALEGALTEAHIEWEVPGE
jgi:hypothetical protein